MKTTMTILACGLLLAIGCSNTTNDEGAETPMQATGESAMNPLLETWDTPYGVPPFDQIDDEHYLPAFHEAMALHKAEVAEIKGNSEAPTFANTIEALERSGAALSQVANVFFAVDAAHSNDKTKEVARTVAPELASHGNDISLDAEIFARVDAVFGQKDELNLSPEQMKLLEETHRGFIRAGAGLDEAAKERIREIDGKLAALGQQFGDNLLDETNDFELVISDEADLGDLPPSLAAGAAAEAKRRGHESGWVFTLQRPSINPFLQYSPNREMRKILFDGYAARGDRGNDKDNNEVLASITELRIERAAIMGHPSHAHFQLEDTMAKDPANAQELMDNIWPRALEAAKREAAALEEMMHADGIDGELQGWDWRYYSEKVRAERYDFDENALRPYFEVSAVRDGVFQVMNKLFGLEFKAENELPRWHPSQEVYEVSDADGSHLGVVYIDFFARESKRGGAWMGDLRQQNVNAAGEMVRPIVTTNFNFPPPTDASPSLLSYREAETFLHEFGHAVHSLLSDVNYASLAGTNTPRDFVEFPSQVFENWLGEPEVLKGFAKHYETGETIPDELIAKLDASSKFNQGFGTTEFMAAALLDMAWHSQGEPTSLSPREFEDQKMAEIGLIDAILPRYRSTYFAHIFSGGYSAGYYSYLWSEVLDADAFQAFKETSLFDKETADRFREAILSKGGTRPGMELYIDFRGREPKIEPLLERRGLIED